MEILQDKGQFYIGDNPADPLAEITYVEAGEKKIIIDHTFVSDELRGQKIGDKLVARAVQFARDNNKTVIPLCPFAKAQFDKHPEYQDVLDK